MDTEPVDPYSTRIRTMRQLFTLADLAVRRRIRCVTVDACPDVFIMTSDEHEHRFRVTSTATTCTCEAFGDSGLCVHVAYLQAREAIDAMQAAAQAGGIGGSENQEQEQEMRHEMT